MTKQKRSFPVHFSYAFPNREQIKKWLDNSDSMQFTTFHVAISPGWNNNSRYSSNPSQDSWMDKRSQLYELKCNTWKTYYLKWIKARRLTGKTTIHPLLEKNCASGKENVEGNSKIHYKKVLLFLEELGLSFCGRNCKLGDKARGEFLGLLLLIYWVVSKVWSVF